MLADFREAVKRPLEFYAPQEFDEETLWEEEPGWEWASFDLPFRLMEELEWFKLGIQEARMHVFDDNIELGLPNKGLLGVLMEVRLDRIEHTIVYSEPKLREVLKHLAKLRYVNPGLPSSGREPLLNNSSAPESFWWRHWKVTPPKASK